MTTPPKPLPNATQRLVRWIGLVALLAMGVFPPWRLTYVVDGKPESKATGYFAVWSPPSDEQEVGEEATDLKFQIDLLRLSLQLVGVLGAVNLGHFLLRSKETSA